MPEISLPRPGPHLQPKLDHPARHKIWCCGRRWHKTSGGIFAATVGHGPGEGQRRSRIGALSGGNIWIIGQSHPESTSIWEEVRDMLRAIASHISEANRKVMLPGGGAISIKSAVSANSLVGDVRGIDGVVMNEGAKFNSLVWQKAIRPALSDRRGWSIWPTTPEGANFFKGLFDNASGPDADGNENPNGDPEWMRWQEASTANPNFDPKEIEASRREGMSDQMIEQEYYARFVLLGAGRTFHEFERAVHLREFAHDRERPLDLCISFNVAPAAWLVTQGDSSFGPERVLCEIHPDGNDSSPRACVAAFAKRFPGRGDGRGVRVYGEIGGRSTGYSDFEVLRTLLPRAQFFTSGESAPKDLTNSVNAILRGPYGDVSAFIDEGCHRLIRDLEFTRNANASFKLGRNEPGLGHYAAAWAAKLTTVYPAVLDSIRSRDDAQRWPEATPEQKRSWRAVEKAKRNGLLVVPPECEECGDPPGHGKSLQAAHTENGYLPENDLRVRFLCRRCHTAFDMANPKSGTGRH